MQYIWKNVMKEISWIFDDNDMPINVESWGRHGSKSIVKIPFIYHLRYDKFK